MDVVGGLIGRAGTVSPRLRARLAWRRLQRQADVAARLVEELVPAGAVALDIGANWGLFAWALEQRVGPRGHVHVFEPNPEHGPSLERMRGKRPNMTVHGVALSDHAGTAQLHIPVRDGRRCSYEATLSGTAAHVQAQQENVGVRLVPLDEILGPDSPAVGFVKCDVEGHEAAVLRGAEHTLRSLPTMLIEIERRLEDGDVGDTFAQLRDLGYAGYAVRAGGLAPLEDFDIEREQRSDVGRSLAGDREYVNDFLFAHPSLDVSRLRERG